MRVAAVQHDIVWENPVANLERLAPRIARAAADGARMIVLTEMFSNGFSMRTDVIAETIDGPSSRFLLDQAAITGAWVCGSIPIRDAGRNLPHNCLVVAGPDGTVHRYAKRHRFAFAGEDRHYSSGDVTLTVTLGDVRTTFFVCFDLRFAPDFWDLAAETDLYVVVANWPASRRAHWLALLEARAIENQAYVLGVNRVGDGNGLAYSGDSRIFDPLGATVAAADPEVEATLLADVDPEVVADVRARFPFLAERGEGPRP